MAKTIFNYSLICSVIVGIAFIFSLLSSKKGSDKQMVYLNLVVLFFTLNNLQIVLIDNVFTQANFFVRNLLFPFYSLIVPAFYTFVTYYLNVEKKIASFVYFTLLLFLLQVLIRMVLFQYYYDADVNYFVARYSQIEEIVNALFSLFLFIKTAVLLFQQSTLYALTLEYDNLKWMKTFLFLGSIILVTWISAILLNLDKVINPQIFIYYPLRLSTSILLFWIGYQGFFNYSVMTERIQIRNDIKTTENKAKDSELKTEINDKFILIQEYIIKHKKYLDANYSLDTLSIDLKISTSSLSKAINQKSGYHFSDFINMLRVEKAKKLLKNPNYNNYTILAIGLECGFNSKSTFYCAFKKITQQTPTAFRQQNINS